MLTRQGRHRSKTDSAKRSDPASAPLSVHRAIRSSGTPLDPATQTRAQAGFHTDFSEVRVHTDSLSARSAHEVGASAYTVGQHIVFAAGQYRPETTGGYRLLTHELAHTLQQTRTHLPRELAVSAAQHPSEQEADAVASGQGNGITQISPLVQRQVAAPRAQSPPTLTGRSASDLMHDPKYLDNHLKSIQFYEARLAVLHYDDGTTIKLGLVPELMTAPVQAVDYRTLRSSHTPILGGDPAKLQFIPRGKEAVEQMSDAAPIGQVFQFARNITFSVDAASGRIVPNEVNSLSAPVLCQVLRESEAEFLKNFNANAAAGKQVFEKLKVVVELLALVDGVGAAKPAASKPATAGATAAAGAENTLTSKFVELLGKKVPGSVTAGGVAYGDVEVALDGTQLMVRRSVVQNVSRLPGQGKLMQLVWEKAAVAAAKQAGAKSVQIALRTIQNPAWKAYLESQGYTWQVVDKLHGAWGVEQALVKTLTL